MKNSSLGYLFKRGNKYYLQYDINGRRKTVSLKTTKKNEAEKKRKKILEPLNTLKNQNDLLYHTARAKKIYSSKDFPINTAWNKFLKELERKESTEDTKKRLLQKWNNFISWLDTEYPELKNLNQLTKDVSKQYADYLLDTGISNKVYNENFNLLFRVVEHFKEEADISINFFDKSIITRRRKNPISRKEFTEEETILLLESIPPSIHK